MVLHTFTLPDFFSFFG